MVRDVVQRREPRTGQECVGPCAPPFCPSATDADCVRPHGAAIDLCNNPATHEPKLQRARRLLPEWTVYDDEVAALAKRVLAEEDADSSSSSSSSSSAAAFKARAHELEQAVQQEQERESFVEEQAAGRASGDSESEREPQGEEEAQHRVKDEL